MKAYDTNLMERLEAWSIDDEESAFPFSQRLARENNWTLNYARRVIREYKRFLFLAVASGHPVTPSDQVDQAWHLHLLYTQSYWGELCPKILGRPLHHGPTRGGSAERQKFHDWYARTLASYRDFFSEPPPEDIWPLPERRFGEESRFARINTARNWVIAKPGWIRGLRSGSFQLKNCFRRVQWPWLSKPQLPIALGSVMLFAGCAEDKGGWLIMMFFLFWCFLFTIAISICARKGRIRWKKDGDSFGGDFGGGGDEAGCGDGDGGGGCSGCGGGCGGGGCGG